MNVLFELLLAYLVYRFIAGFLIPLFRTTRQMRQQFQDVHSRTTDEGSNPGASHPGQTTEDQAGKPKTGESKVGEYIDFEEVK